MVVDRRDRRAAVEHSLIGAARAVDRSSAAPTRRKARARCRRDGSTIVSRRWGTDEFAQVARDFNSMTERLDELDRMKRDFVSKVSHDLKTPLSSMQETIGALLDELPGPLTPKQRQLLELNRDSGRRLVGDAQQAARSVAHRGRARARLPNGRRRSARAPLGRADERRAAGARSADVDRRAGRDACWSEATRPGLRRCSTICSRTRSSSRRVARRLA